MEGRFRWCVSITSANELYVRLNDLPIGGMFHLKRPDGASIEGEKISWQDFVVLDGGETTTKALWELTEFFTQTNNA